MGDQEVATCAHGTSVISAVTVLSSSLQAGVGRKPGPPVFPLACTRQEYPDADHGKGRERGPLGPGGQDTALLETYMWLCLRGQVQGAGTLVPGPTPSTASHTSKPSGSMSMEEKPERPVSTSGPRDQARAILPLLWDRELKFTSAGSQGVTTSVQQWCPKPFTESDHEKTHSDLGRDNWPMLKRRG